MENPPNTNNQLLKQPLGKALVVGLLVILLVAGFFIVTKGSDIDFCFFSNCPSIVPPQTPPIVPPVVPLAAGAAVAAVLVTIVEAPLMVAVGVGIVVWWFASSLFHAWLR